jgi:hypothetical protein
MTPEFLRNLRLAIAITLVCIWAMGSLATIPVLDGAYLLVIAPMIQRTHAEWNQPIVWRHRESAVAMLVVGALILGAFLLPKWVPEEAGRAFMHSPPVVLAIWLLATLALVRQATEIARVAAAADPRAATTASSRNHSRRDPSLFKD